MSVWQNLRCAIERLPLVRLMLLAALVWGVASPATAAWQDSAETQVSEETLKAALEKAGENRAELEKAISSAPEDQTAAVRFLIAYMPEDDLQSLSSDYILKNVDYAYKARAATPWGKEIPEEIFFNDVLPYASINERRDDWRPDFYERFLPLVKDCKTPGEAAQALNRQMFPLLNVQYHATKRPKPNQSPYESIEASYASCSGLSVLLIDACRAVCVPTRFAGTASWTTKRGNHSWVEIWSDGSWHFTGACEPDPSGLDRGWFTADAAQADKDTPRNAIWASSWKPTGDAFPLVWARRDSTVPGVNVTTRYTGEKSETAIPAGKVLVSLDVFSAEDGGRERIVCDVVVRAGDDEVASGKTTGSGDDTNNRLDVLLTPNTEYAIEITTPAGDAEKQTFATTAETRQLKRFTVGQQSAETPASAGTDDPAAKFESFLAELAKAHPDAANVENVPLTREEAEQAAELMTAAWLQEIRATLAEEMEKKEFSLGDKTLKFDYKVFGDKPAGGRSLFFSLHGGGNARPRVNDRQWENQKGLYQPEEGVYLAPRAPTNTWNLWHEAHIDPMFDHLIQNMVAFEDVNPNRVYVMGYSAGGDGVYQIGPRMADRWAAAAMMAGHPNEAQPVNLRNIGFALHVGGDDGAYSRNQVAKDWGEKLAKLHEEDPEGYITQVQIHEGRGHWMNLEDAVAVPWMAEFTRETRPKKIVWRQDDVTHDRFYWLVVGDDDKQAGDLIRASVDGQTIDLQTEGVDSVTVLLDDRLVDLDQPVSIRLNGNVAFEGKVERTLSALSQSMDERGDGTIPFCARVTVTN